MPCAPTQPSQCQFGVGVARAWRQGKGEGMDERMEEAQKGFLRHLAAKGYSQEIVDDYGEDVEVLLTFLTAQGVKDLKAVGEGQLRAYGEWVEVARNFKTKEPLSAKTKAARRRSAKRFFQWMEWTGRLEEHTSELQS